MTRVAWDPLTRRRGPFVLQVIRETPQRKIKWHTELIKGTFKAADVREEAELLLGDPRDTVVSVLVWSVRDQEHVFTLRKGDFKKRRVR